MNAAAMFLAAVLIPVFFASPRTVPMWLSIQAVALAWNVGAHQDLYSLHTQVAIAELLLVRGVVAPWFLRRAASCRDETVDHLLPSNLFAWILGISAAVIAFEFAVRTAQPGMATTMGYVSVTVVLALLLLSSNGATGAQIFALLLLENAAALLESSLPSAWSLWVHGALTLVYVLTVATTTHLASQPGTKSDLTLPKQVL